MASPRTSRIVYNWLPAAFFLLIVASFAIYSQSSVRITLKYPSGSDSLSSPRSSAGQRDYQGADSSDRGCGNIVGDFHIDKDLFPPFWEERSPGLAPTWDGHSPLCTSNTSAAKLIKDFSTLPKMIQDFLTHRHCRHFELVLEPRISKCEPGPITLLIAIKSDARNLARRDVIRRTWGQERKVKGTTVRRVFLFGVASNVESDRRLRLNALLQEEARLYNDILQWNFLDTFFNLTLKQVLFFDWLAERCSGSVRYIFNGDDDIFVNTDNMLEFVTSSGDKARAGSGKQHMYEGYVISNVGPIRYVWSKYYVPEQVYESNVYPPYVGGGGIIMSNYTAMQIHRAAVHIPMLPIDDVFMGQCLQLVGLRPRRNGEFRTAGIHNPKAGAGDDGLSSYHPCYYREVLIVHSLEPFEVQLMWGALQRPWLRCGRPPNVGSSVIPDDTAAVALLNKRRK